VQLIVIIALWMLWILSWLAAAMLDPRSRRLSTLQSVCYDIVVLIGGFTLLFGFVPDQGFDIRNLFWQPIEGPLGWSLVAVVVLALGTAWVARAHVGFALPDSKTSHPQFVENGPFRLLRQPIHFALILAVFTTAAASGRPSSFGAAALLTVAFLARIIAEERVLRDMSPEFDDYADRVPMLLPLPARREAVPVHARTIAPLPPKMPEVQAEPADPIEAILEPAVPVAAPATPEVILQDEKLGSDLGLKPGAVTTKAVQLTLALDDPEEPSTVERPAPAEPVAAEPAAAKP
jgi:protein-S-isoprenylcysteine O-methyltransferase Ste14